MSGERGSRTPPALALLLLRLALPRRHREFVIGDLVEEFGTRDPVTARSWFWRQALGSLAATPRRRSPGRGRPRLTAPFGGSGVGHDVRHALRGLYRRPGFAIVSALTIAVGVGATSSVFSYVDATILRPLPGTAAPTDRLGIVTYQSVEDPNRTLGVSYLNFLDLDAGSTAVERLVASSSLGQVQLGGSGVEARPLQGDAVTRGYFDLLGVRPHMGRFFTDAELAPEASDPVAVISHRLWTTTLRSDPAILGRVLALNGVRLTVVGVAGKGFVGHERVSNNDLWVPAGLYSVMRHNISSTANRAPRVFRQNIVLLAPGATFEQAEAELKSVMARLVEAYPDEAGLHRTYQPKVFAGIGTEPRRREGQWGLPAMLFALAMLVLLTSCANNTNLLYTRSVARRGEGAVRRALGASRAQLIRQHLTESLVISVMGGVLGVAIAFGLNHLFWEAPAMGVVGIAVNLRVLAFAIATASTVPMAFALIPAWIAGRVDVTRNLPKSGGMAGPRRALLRSGLTIVQLSLSLILLVGSGLMLRTIQSLSRVDTGFDPEGLVLSWVDPGPQGYTPEHVMAFHSELQRRAQALPGVERTALAVNGPFETNYHPNVLPAGAPPGADEVDVALENLAPGYFETLGIPLLGGRDFRAEEMVWGAAQTNEAVILSESAARSVFGDAIPLTDVIGRSFEMDDASRTVIGVVGDVKTDFREGPEAIVYQPLAAETRVADTKVKLIVSTSRPLDETQAALRAMVAGLDPNLPIYYSDELTGILAMSASSERLIGRLLLTLGLLASGLAAIGLFAVVRWSVAERTREIGLRVALGAKPSGVVRLVARQVLVIALVGAVIGYGASAALASVMRGMLFGIGPFDPVAWGASAAALLAVAAIATLQPARAAIKVQPTEALRYE